MSLTLALTDRCQTLATYTEDFAEQFGLRRITRPRIYFVLEELEMVLNWLMNPLKSEVADKVGLDTDAVVPMELGSAFTLAWKSLKWFSIGL